jgi:nitrous oxidase accessory protein NosD
MISALALAFGAQQMSAAAITYIVGTCTSGTQFSTIQSALDASPAPSVVEVCPGQYAERLTITKPVTIEGISGSQNPDTFGGEGNGSLARIILPGAYTPGNVILFGEQPATAQCLLKLARKR